MTILCYILFKVGHVCVYTFLYICIYTYICLLYVYISTYIWHINKTHVLIKLFCVANCKNWENGINILEIRKKDTVVRCLVTGISPEKLNLNNMFQNVK